jgi:excisionase family DNA binding protein
MTSKLSPLLTITQVADHLKVNPRTVRRAIEKGELHAHQVGKLPRISEEDLAAFLSARRR